MRRCDLNANVALMNFTATSCSIPEPLSLIKANQGVPCVRARMTSIAPISVMAPALKNRRGPHHSAALRDAVNPFPRGNDRNPDSNQHRRQPRAEGHDEQHPESQTVQGNRGKQHDKGGRAGNNAAGDAKRNQAFQRNRAARQGVAVRFAAVTVRVKMSVTMRMVMIVVRVVGMRVRFRFVLRVGMNRLAGRFFRVMRMEMRSSVRVGMKMSLRGVVRMIVSMIVVVTVFVIVCMRVFVVMVEWECPAVSAWQAATRRRRKRTARSRC